MAKLVFPAVVNKAYAGTMSEYRYQVQKMAYFFRKSPKAAVDLRNSITGFANRLGLSAVANAAVVAVRNSAVTDTVNGTAVVTGAGAFTGVNLPATTAMVDNAEATVPLGDATAVANGQDNGTAAIAAGVITRITLPTTDKIVKSGVKYLMPAATGTYVNGYTFTVVNGAITAAVAS